MWQGLRSFWREYAVSWARIGKDRRAWPVVARGTFLLLAIPLWLLLVLGQVGNREQRIAQFFFNAFVFGLGLIALFVLRRLNRLDNELLNTSITGNTPAALPSQEVHANVRAYLADRMLIIGTLFARALVESQPSPHQAPDGDTGIRQGLNHILRRRELWANLEPTEAALCSLPQGAWPTADRNLAIDWAEQLRLLRWLFRLDDELLPLAAFPRWDSVLVSRLWVDADVQIPQVARSLWEVRLEGDSAQLYCIRALAELQARQIMPAEILPLQGFRDSLAGESTDLLVGKQSFSELSASDLGEFVATAAARFHYASYLTEILAESEVQSYSQWLHLRTGQNPPTPADCP